MSIIDDIKQKTDIAEVIGQYTRLTRSGKTLKGLCPFHSEKHGSFFVYPEQQSWHCFGACGTGGDVFSFIMKKEGCDFTEAKKSLAERAGVTLTPESNIERESKEKNDRLYRINEAACEYYHQTLLSLPEAEKTRQYLVKRGLDASSVENFKLGYAPLGREALIQNLGERGFSVTEMETAGLAIAHEGKAPHDLFRHRLLFPITDIKGRVTGFGGRALDDSLPKYLNTPQTDIFDKKATLYGLDRAKESAGKQDHIVIVEGYMDVIVPHQYGFQNVVASMGTAISEIHARTLKKITRRMILALDADSAGEEAMARSVGLENVIGAEIRVAILPPGQDPDELVVADAAAWPRLIADAAPVVDFIFSRVTAPLNLKSARGKAEASEKLLPVISQIKDAVRRAHYVNKLAEITGVQSRELEYELIQDKTVWPVRKTPARTKEQKQNAVEDYFLTLLLKCPECKSSYATMPLEYFEGTENREIFRAACSYALLEEIERALDEAIWERCRQLLASDVITDQTELRLSNLALRLKEEYYKRLAQRKEGIIEPETTETIRQIFVDKEKLGAKRRKQ